MRGVERQRAHVDAVAPSSAAHQRLGAVGARRGRSPSRSTAPTRTVGVGEQRGRRSTPPRRASPSTHERRARRARDRPSARRPTPRRRRAGRAPAQRGRRSAIAAAGGDRVDLGLEHLGRRSTAPPRSARRAPRPAGRTACGTRGSRTAAAPRRGRRGPACSVVEVDVERRRRARSTITSALLAHPRLVLGQVLAAASASARRRGRRCRRGRRTC